MQGPCDGPASHWGLATPRESTRMRVMNPNWRADASLQMPLLGVFGSHTRGAGPRACRAGRYFGVALPKTAWANFLFERTTRRGVGPNPGPIIEDTVHTGLTTPCDSSGAQRSTSVRVVAAAAPDAQPAWSPPGTSSSSGGAGSGHRGRTDTSGRSTCSRRGAASGAR